MHVRLAKVLDKIVASPVLVRKLKGQSGIFRIKDANGQTVEVNFERTQAGYINFVCDDETLKLRIPDRYVKPG